MTGHAAASLNQDGSTKVRLLDKGLDPAAPVKAKAPTNPYQQALTLESKAKKANAPKPRNPYQDARNMEKKAEKMLEPSVAGKIFNGLGELWTKAPAGIVEALSGAKDALTSEEMKKGAEFGFRSAWEVMQEAGKMAGKDAVFAFATKNLPVGTSLLASKAYTANSAREALAGGHREIATKLSKSIQRIKKDVWKDGEQ